MKIEVYYTTCFMANLTRRNFLKSALLSCAALLTLSGGFCAPNKDSIYMTKLCKMARLGYFGKVLEFTKSENSLKIRGAKGFGEATLTSLIASAPNIAEFNC